MISNSNRFDSIDILRGLVMVIMALDHVRDYFHYGSFLFSPTDLEQTTPAIFFTRWITHYCAPVFVFLAGTSAFMVNERKGGSYASKFLLSRGLWLIFLEATVVSLGWSFYVQCGGYFQVIWAIGVSMMVLGVFCRLPLPVVLVTGFLLVFGHNFLDPVAFEHGTVNEKIWGVLHETTAVELGNGTYYFEYPVLPWIGVMMLGYCFGVFYTRSNFIEKRKKWLLILGSCSVVIFILFRFFHVYGDSSDWTEYPDKIYSLMSFLNVTKYPPSLLYILITLGPALIFLAVSERLDGKWSKILVTFGRVPLFYYVLHLYLIHALAILNIMLFFPGYDWKAMLIYDWGAFVEALKGYGYGLPGTYLVWSMVVAMLYYPCKKYAAYKKENSDKWWLSYL